MILVSRFGLAAALSLPLFLMHGRSIAEVSIGVTDAAFLAHCILTHDWIWLRRAWVRLALVWWAWLVFCSLPIGPLGPGGWFDLGEALAVGRLLLLTAALEHLILADAAALRAMRWVVSACALYIGVQAVWQFATGTNLYGMPPGAAGELTGPFDKPRAGPPLARILPPALIPAAAALLSRRRLPATLGAYLLLLVGVLVMVVISQRMPLVLTVLGLVLSALLLPRLRPAVLLAGAAGAALVATSAVLSPATWRRVVLQFSQQLRDFPHSHYGFLFGRAWTMAQASPLTGRGFDGFRTGCPLPQFDPQGLAMERARLGIEAVCAPHPHNFYIQALTDGGWPGLILFVGLAMLWLRAAAAGLWTRAPDPLRVGLFASLVIQLWPIASTNSFFTPPMGGWFFLLLGWTLAAARAEPATAAARTQPATATGV